MIVSLGPGVIPGVQVTLTAADLLAGHPWRVEAVYWDDLDQQVTYQPRGASGIGTGSQVVLVDYAAPIRRTTHYRLYRDGTTLAGATSIIRTSSTANAITSLDGRQVAAFAWTAAGAPREPVLRGVATEVPGNPFRPTRLAPVAGRGGGSLAARTVGVDTARMLDLLHANRLAYLLHSCDMPQCDIPPIALVRITSASSDRVAGGLPTREWALRYEFVADPEPSLLIGASTWDDFNARWGAYSWADFSTSMAGRTWGDFGATDWSSFA